MASVSQENISGATSRTYIIDDDKKREIEGNLGTQPIVLSPNMQFFYDEKKGLTAIDLDRLVNEEEQYDFKQLHIYQYNTNQEGKHSITETILDWGAAVLFKQLLRMYECWKRFENKKNSIPDDDRNKREIVDNFTAITDNDKYNHLRTDSASPLYKKYTHDPSFIPHLLLKAIDCYLDASKDSSKKNQIAECINSLLTGTIQGTSDEITDENIDDYVNLLSVTCSYSYEELVGKSNSVLVAFLKLKAQLVTKQADLSYVQAQLAQETATYTAEIAGSNRELIIAQQALADAIQKEAVIASHVADLVRSSGVTVSDDQDLSKLIAAVKSAFTATIDQKNSQISRLQNDLPTNEGDAKTLRAQLEMAQQDITKLRQAQQSFTQLSLDSAAKLVAANAELNALQEVLNEELSGKSQELELLRSNFADLRSQLSIPQSTSSYTLRDLQQRLADLQEKERSLNAVTSERNTARSNKSLLETSVDKLTRENEDLIRALAELEAKLQEELETKRRIGAGLQAGEDSERARLTAKNIELQSKIETLNADIERLRQERGVKAIDEMRQDLTQTILEKKKLEDDLHTSQQALKQLTSNSSQLDVTQNIEQIESELIGTLRAQLAAAQAQLAQSQNKPDQSVEISNLNQRIRELTAKLDTVGTEHAETILRLEEQQRSELAAARAELETNKANVARLTQEVAAKNATKASNNAAHATALDAKNSEHRSALKPYIDAASKSAFAAARADEKVDTLQAEIKRLKSLMEKFGQTDQQIAQIQRNLDATKAEKAAAEQAAREAAEAQTVRIKELEEQAAAQKIAHTEALAARNTTHAAALEEKEAQLDAARAAQAASEKAAATIVLQIQQLNLDIANKSNKTPQEIAAIERQLDDAKAAEKAAREAAEAQTVRIKELQGQLDDQTAAYDAALKAKNEERAIALAAKNSAHATDLQALQARLESALAKQKQKDAALVTAEAEVVRIREELYRLNQSTTSNSANKQARIKSFEDRLVTLESSEQSAREAAKAQAATIAALERQLAQQTIAHNAALAARNTEHTAALQALQLQINVAKKEEAAAASAAKDASEASSVEIKRLQALLKKSEQTEEQLVEIRRQLTDAQKLKESAEKSAREASEAQAVTIAKLERQLAQQTIAQTAALAARNTEHAAELEEKEAQLVAAQATQAVFKEATESASKKAEAAERSVLVLQNQLSELELSKKELAEAIAEKNRLTAKGEKNNATIKLNTQNIDTLNARIYELTAITQKHAGLERNLEAVVAENERAKRELASLNNQKQSYDGRVKEMQEQLDNALAAQKAAEAQSVASTAELTDLQEKHAELQSHLDELHANTQEIIDLKRQLSQSDTDKEGIQSRLDEANAEKARLEAAAAATKKRIQSLEDDLQVEKAKTVDLEKIRQRLASLEGEKDAASVELEQAQATVAALRSEKGSNTAALANAEASTRAAQTALEEKEAEISSLKLELQTKGNVEDQLDAAKKALEQSQARVAAIEKDLEKKNRANQELQNAQIELEKSKVAADQALAAVQMELYQLRSEHTKTQQQLRLREEEVDRLKRELKELRQLRDSVSGLEQSLKASKEEAAAAQAKVVRLQKIQEQLEASEAKVARLTASQQESKDRVIELEASSLTQNRELVTLRQRQAETEAQLTGAKLEVAQLEKSTNNKQKELEAAQARIQVLETTQKQNADALAAANAELEQLRKTSQAQAEQLAAATQGSADLRTQVVQLKADVVHITAQKVQAQKDLRQQTDELMDRITKLRKEIKEKKPLIEQNLTELGTLRADKRTNLAILSKLEKSNQGLTQELEQKNSELSALQIQLRTANSLLDDNMQIIANLLSTDEIQKEEIEELLVKRSKLSNEIARLTEQTTKSAELQEKTQQLREVNGQLTELQNQAQETKIQKDIQLSALKQSFATVNQKMAQHTLDSENLVLKKDAELADVRKALEAAQARFSALETQKRRSLNDSQSAFAEIMSGKEEENKVLRRTILDLQSKVNVITAEKESAVAAKEQAVEARAAAEALASQDLSGVNKAEFHEIDEKMFYFYKKYKTLLNTEITALTAKRTLVTTRLSAKEGEISQLENANQGDILSFEKIKLLLEIMASKKELFNINNKLLQTIILVMDADLNIPSTKKETRIDYNSLPANIESENASLIEHITNFDAILHALNNEKGIQNPDFTQIQRDQLDVLLTAIENNNI
jgi:chromosome segregation ATPase